MKHAFNETLNFLAVAGAIAIGVPVILAIELTIWACGREAWHLKHPKNSVN